jgi:hypothetical protein
VEVCWENLLENNHFRGLEVDGKITLGWILGRYIVDKLIQNNIQWQVSVLLVLNLGFFY